MKFPVLWSGLYCYTVKCSKILAHIKLLYNPRVNKVFRFSKMTKGRLIALTAILKMNTARRSGECVRRGIAICTYGTEPQLSNVVLIVVLF